MKKKTKLIAAGVAVVLVIAVIAGILLANNRSDTAKPACDNPTVKGNISMRTNEKIYHLPQDRYYDDTHIDTGNGERWFCSEQEAQAAGWRRTKN